MTEAKRWQEEGAPSDYARLLRAARNEWPSPQSLQRALVSTGIVGATSLVANSAAGAGVASSVGSAAGKGLLGVATKFVAVSLLGAGTIVTTTAVIKQHRPTVVQSAPAPSLNSAKAGVGPSHGVFSAQQVDEQGNVETAPCDSAVTSAERARESDQQIQKPGSGPQLKPSNGASAPGEASANGEQQRFFEEMALIDVARAGLRSGAAADALRNAKEYESKFAAGRFAPEALFLVMQASRQLGQWDTATAAARQILERFPNSPHAGHARELLRFCDQVFPSEGYSRRTEMNHEVP